MLDLCVLFGADHPIIFNSKKSFCVNISAKWTVPSDNLSLGGTAISWVDRFQYLRITFIAGMILQPDLGVIKNKCYSVCN